MGNNTKSQKGVGETGCFPVVETANEVSAKTARFWRTVLAERSDACRDDFV